MFQPSSSSPPYLDSSKRKRSDEQQTTLKLESEKHGRSIFNFGILVTKAISTDAKICPMKAMKIMTWNTRVLENPHGIHTLRDLVRKEGPDLVISQEKKMETRVMETKNILSWF